MSKDTKDTAKANDVLPDDDALGAFRATAFAPRKPRTAKPAAAKETAAGEEGNNKEAPPKAPPAPEVTPAPPAPTVPEVAETTDPPKPEPATVPKPASSEEPPTPPTGPAPEPAVVAVRSTPEPAAIHRPTRLAGPPATTPDPIEIPDLGTMGTRPVQCTVMVASSTRDRLAHYQLTKKMETNREPTNATVIRRAFLHARKNGLFGKLLYDLYQRQAPSDDEDFDDDGLLGDVAGRRTERGRMKDNVQQSFRPSMQELAAYDAFSTGYSFPNRSEFVDAILDEFLPKLPSSGRRR